MKYLSRTEASEYLCARGIHIAPKTLQKYASTGGGPEFRKFGRRVLYTEQELTAWIDSKITPPKKNSGDAVDKG